jgi:hypothetical protein
MQLSRYRALLTLEKEYSFSGSPAGASTIGYLNPLYSHPTEKKKKKKENLLYVQG